MGPAELEAAAARLAAAHDGATCDSVVGDDLLAANYPQVRLRCERARARRDARFPRGM